MKKRLFTLFVCVAALELVVTGACSTPALLRPAETPTATITIAPTATVTPSKTPKPPTATPYPEFYTETFRSNFSAWSHVVTLGDSSDFFQSQTDNGLRLQLDDPKLYVYYFYDPYSYEDVILDLLYKNLGHNSNNINLLCRSSEDGWYEFTVQNDGLYQIWAFDIVGDQGYVLLASGGSTAILSGYQENEINISCIGNTLTLSINQKQIKTVTDNQFFFTEGQVGFGVNISFYNPVTPVVVEIESLTISRP